MHNIEHLSLQGPAGILETRLHRSNLSDPEPWVMLICHPHPLYGGSMDNKVVTTLAKAGGELQMQVLRFNYRGVGKSEGKFGNAEGECDDLRAVIAYVKQIWPKGRLVLCGFSFGAYIAAKLASEMPEVKALFTIAPAVLHYDFSTLPKVACPWFLVQGDADEIVPPQSVYDWLARTSQTIQRIDFIGATHFFHGRLLELKQTVLDCLQKIVQI